MNLLHMKYALAVAETNSINKAAEELIVGAPALSRAIKELESGLGVSLFERSAKGMFLTPDGELFVRYAKNALKQIDDIESLFKNGSAAKKQFSVSVPKAGYIDDAFVNFTKRIDRISETDILYNETGFSRVIKNIIEDGYKLGILRYSMDHDNYYKNLLNEKGLSCELIAEFEYAAVMSEKSPLASLPAVSFSDLKEYTEIVYADPYNPSLPMSESDMAESPESGHCRIYIFERGSQFDLLSKNPDTYMFLSPSPGDLLERYDLVERRINENKKIFKDVLIRRSDYRLSELDKIFIDELVKSKRRIFNV